MQGNCSMAIKSRYVPRSSKSKHSDALALYKLALANLYANSASYPHWEGKRVVGYGGTE